MLPGMPLYVVAGFVSEMKSSSPALFGYQSMGFFSKPKKTEAPSADLAPGTDGTAANGNGGAAAPPPPTGAAGAGGFHRDLAKALKFFQHGSTMADARNFDYAIDMYISGLKHNPDSIERHDQLHEIAKKRKVANGKPMGKLEILKESMGVSKNPVDKMLFKEKVWSKDPFNLEVMIDLMELANAADKSEPDLMIRELTYWIGSLVLDSKLTNKALNPKDFIRVMKLLREVGALKQAIEACKSALFTDSSNQELIQTLKDLETEEAISKGGYDKTGSAKNTSQKDAKAQRDREQDDQLSKTDSQLEEQIKRRRLEVAAKPEDMDLASKLVDSLLERTDEALEAEAVVLLNRMYDTSGQYRFKARAGDVKMKQEARKVEALKKLAETHKDNAQYAADYKAANLQRYKNELEEYTARVREYPTENGPRYQLARRLVFFKRYDEAISELQIAKKDAKVRSACYELLGDCFRIQGYLDEAIDTLRQGLSEHTNKLDKAGLQLQYMLMDSLERAATKNNNLEQAREALKTAGAILQAEINFKDIRVRVDNLRKLVAKLGAKPEENGASEPKPV
jgi:hypothetical protein